MGQFAHITAALVLLSLAALRATVGGGAGGGRSGAPALLASNATGALASGAITEPPFPSLAYSLFGHVLRNDNGGDNSTCEHQVMEE
jgi:hypothetical protein